MSLSNGTRAASMRPASSSVSAGLWTRPEKAPNAPFVFSHRNAGGCSPPDVGSWLTNGCDQTSGEPDLAGAETKLSDHHDPAPRVWFDHRATTRELVEYLIGLGHRSIGHLAGPPDLVVEVVSPSTAARDRGQKLERYRTYGVPEYWVVDPDRRTVEVWRFGDGAREPTRYGPGDILEWQPGVAAAVLEISVGDLLGS